MSGIEITQILPGILLGEGPHWMDDQQCLLFVDILKGDAHRYFLKTKRHQILHIEDAGSGDNVSIIIPIEGATDLFIVTVGRSLAVIHWSPSDPDNHTVKVKTVLHTVDAHLPNNRFNDGKCDPQGRLWAGTYACEKLSGEPVKHMGSLYCLDVDLTLTDRVNKVSVSNGLAWSLDKKTFYYNDSLAYSIDAFDYDDESSKICSRRTVLDYKTSGLQKDVPDGMCIDETGNLWVANFYGKKVICVDPKVGKIIHTVELPTQNVTSVCWGGEDYSTLFVTSAQTGLKTEELASQSAAGSIFAVNGLGVKGLPATNFRVNLQMLKNRINFED
ncbi:regucalcin-like [Panulirus ornatus]|uniref:regucalcin-like n=1 Tax=Panulirus ornatus TaxID=150431 RepID=UPI003A859C45